jgi:hypothetical protein
VVINYSEELIKKYQKYMLKNGVGVSKEQANLDLESFASVYLSFATIDKDKKKYEKEK